MDGEAQAGPVDDPDVVVEGDPQGIYRMFVDRRIDGMKVKGDRALLEELIAAAPTRVEATVA